MFKSNGIPSCHIICVMRHDHLNSFPPSLICIQWLKDAKNNFYFIFINQIIWIMTLLVLPVLGVLVASCNRLCEIVGKLLDNFNFVMNEILKLTKVLQQQRHMHSSDSHAEDDVGDPDVDKTKVLHEEKMARRIENALVVKKLVSHVSHVY